MRPIDKIDLLIKKLKTSASPELDRRIDDLIVQSQMNNTGKLKPWSNFMRKTYKFAAAAIVIIAALLSLTLFDKTVQIAYAIEQTIEANQSLRFIHLKCEPAGNGVEELWAQFDDQGQLQHLRMNFPDTEDGPKDVVWQEGKAEVWFKAKKGAAVVREEAMLTRLKMSYGDFDPKLIVKKLYQSQNDKKDQIDIQESRSKGEPIIITLTSNDFRDIYKVNPETKLLQQIEKYKMKNGDYKLLGIIKYLDYNQPADPEIFVLKLPADVIRVDQTTQTVGLEQGEMTNEEVAIEVVRRFWMAVIAKDYDTAGQYLEGVPGASLKIMFEEKVNVTFLEIVSVGPVGPHPNPQTKGVIVPCTLKIENNGKIEELTFGRLGVREVYNQPGRWTIFGGI